VKAPQPPSDGLTAVLRTAQYLALLRSDTDIWRELGHVVERFFAADIVTLLERGPAGEISTRYCTLTGSPQCERLAGEVYETTRQVLDSGFLASEMVSLPEPYAVALLPLTRNRKTTTALLIGHRGNTPLSERALDTYLAVAGLFEGTLARLGSELAASENARLLEEQRRIAVALQENLMSPLPQIAGLELGLVVESAYQPALVGGDFSDVFALERSLVCVLIGDVAGKGIRAAGLTERVRSTVRAFAMVDSSPAFILRRTNQLLLRYETQGEFVTAFLLMLDTQTGEARFASAGHPPPALANGRSCQLLETSFGVPLGSFDRDYLDGHLLLSPEDCLVFYTDGVTEARRGVDLFGDERLLEAVAGLQSLAAQQIAEGVRDAAAAYAGQLSDDIEVLALRLRLA
jgi:serine phosphatase RsbU (regulator of sigma subunit)